jgi:hypothetical protein
MSERVMALVPAASFSAACANLHRFVVIEATAMAQLVGFGWQGDPQAPADYRSLLLAYVRSQVSGQPLPVSDEHTDPSIYGSVEATLALRFWHDLTHVRLHQGFDLDGEIEVATAQLDVLNAAGFQRGSLEYELLHADTLGQTVCVAATGTFPKDQMCFARESLANSLTAAIRAQLERAS